MADAPAVTFAPTEDQALIRSTSRRFLEDRVGMERVRELMTSEDGFDPVLWKEMAELGWTGLMIPEEHGGSGLAWPEMSVLLEEMGRLVTPGPFFASAVLAATAISELAGEAQQQRLLPALASGETVATLAVFEQPRRWSVEGHASTARRVDRGWVLDGAKRSVLAGNSADLILVTATTDDGVGVFAVPADADGMSIEPEPVFDPTRRQSTVSLQSVMVGDEARLDGGEEVDGLKRVLRLASAALASEQVGGAQRCMEMSVEYAKTRFQFGRPIGSYQAIKHRCANMLVQVEHARSVAYYAARVSDDEAESRVAAPLAAAVASDAYVWVAGENIQVHGGIGFTWEHDAHIYLKRAKASSLLLGTSRYHRDLLGDAIGI